MNILVLNCGSSSVKAEVIDAQTGARLLGMKAERIDSNPVISFSDSEKEISCAKSGQQAVLEYAFELLVNRAKGFEIQGVGHRVVHGGDAFDQAV